MKSTARTRGAAATAAVGVAAGIVVAIWGVAGEQPVRSVSGGCLAIISLTICIANCVRIWVSNTTAERILLGQATRDADAERARYIAAQAALELERKRVQRDGERTSARLAAQLAAEREALHRDIEEQRAKIICETLVTTVGLMHDGMMEDSPSEHGKIIGFPTQEQRARQAEGTSSSVPSPGPTGASRR